MTGNNGTAQAHLREYYGKTLRRTEDLRFGACCTTETSSRFHEILRLIPEEVKTRQYGCGSPIPADDLTGLTVVDLGCGAGTDCFILSRLVGPGGRVIGLDMTEEQLVVARRNAESVMARFGFAASNVEFRAGFIESADSVPAESVDLVVSNCVINLSPFKEQVFRTIRRMLKPGGEFTISDIVSDRRLPAEIRDDRLLHGECLAGAEYYNDLRDIMETAGFRDVREVSRRTLEDRVGLEGARFCSVTLRGFKLPELDRRCEDYGQFAEYDGTSREQPAEFRLDGGHLFERGRPVAVCRNTALLLTQTRLAKYFRVTPPRKHFGIFPCAPAQREAKAPESCCG
ncbi:MAG: methyltransferase domain-containing protein [Planctomycetes bacterium]|nr:methyltransferase domain-containing protein [Planctomycetota bacterium]